MNCCRLAVITILSFISFTSQAQTISLIGTSEEFILENIKGYASVQQRGIEHEEYDVLVFEDKERELSFFFTFYRGEKVCNYIKNTAPVPSLKQEIEFVKSNFTRIKENIWEKPDKSVQVQITEVEGMGVMVVKGIR